MDFRLSDNDRKLLDATREEALICRQYARHYDENEHEFPPENCRGEPETGLRTRSDRSP